MNIKLADLLFEEDENKEEVGEKEEVEGIPKIDLGTEQDGESVETTIGQG